MHGFWQRFGRARKTPHSVEKSFQHIRTVIGMVLNYLTIWHRFEGNDSGEPPNKFSEKLGNLAQPAWYWEIASRKIPGLKFLIPLGPAHHHIQHSFHLHHYFFGHEVWTIEDYMLHTLAINLLAKNWFQKCYRTQVKWFNIGNDGSGSKGSSIYYVITDRGGLPKWLQIT